MDDLELLLTLPPEVLQQQLNLGTLDERGQLLAQQMARAEALRRASGTRHSTGLGAALGGIGDVINSTAGAMRLGELDKRQEALLGKKDAGRAAFADALRRYRLQRMQQVPPSAGMGDVPLLSPGMG